MADLKITQLTENTTPVGADLLPLVDDPAGTPLTQKITLTSVATWLATLTQTLAGKTLTAPIITNVMDYVQADGQVNALGNLGATETIDWASGTHFTGTLDSNITLTFSNTATGRRITLYLAYSGAQRTITWPAVTWLDNDTGAAPVAPNASGKVMIVTLQDIAGTIYASATGNYAVY